MLRWRWFIIAAVMLLTAYPICELTRCIFKYNHTGTRNLLSLGSDDYLELALVWGLYICVPFILNIAFKLAHHEGEGGL